MAGRTGQLSRWRVGVCGSSHHLPRGCAEFCFAIGKALGRRDTVVTVHSGLKRRAEAELGTFAADWHFVEGVRQTAGDRLEDCVETVVSESDLSDFDGATGPGERRASGRAELFVEGRVRRSRGRTREARRFSFANSLDAIIGVGGGYGTSQLLTLGFALEISALPVPCFGERAKRIWDEHRAELVRALGIDEQTARSWERPPAGQGEGEATAELMVERLLAQLPRRAFVIMPFRADLDTLFDLVIEPAIAVLGDSVIRLDRAARPGSITDHIEQGIRSCDYAVAVLDGWRPNVLYELGFAHALRKPVILLLQRGDAGGLEDVPFDISTMQRLEYERPDRDLLQRFSALVRTVVKRGIR